MVAPGATTLILDAPITAVVVYPKQARVTRRGTVTLPPGAEDAGGGPPEVTVTLGSLPMELDTSSVRVSGRGAVRVLGVDVVVEPRAVTADPRLAELEDEVDRLRRRARELADDEETEQARRRFLDVAARNGAAALARGWGAPSWGGGPAEGGTTPPSGEERRLAEASGALATQLAGIHARLRAIADEQENVQKLTDATRRALEARRGVRLPDTRQVVVALEPTGGPGAADGKVDVELEVSYLVASASWSARYDARLVGGVVTLTWFGMVRQRSGEDWPVGDLKLSTARPGRASGLPELTPWYVDVAHPPVMPFAMAARGGAFAGGAAFDAAAEMTPVAAAAPAKAPGAAPPPPPVEHAVATVDTSGTAAIYRPARPVAVPADGRPHRTTLAVLELEAQLDYLTVPKLAPEAYLRATVTNTSAHTLLPGPVAVFHDADFVGTSAVELVPPGAEVELQLGVDDRLLVERELVSRATSRKVVGNLRRTDVGYVITLTNHTPRRAQATVRDQIPVSRHEGITVKDFQSSPTVGERTDLGQLTWTVDLEPAAQRRIEFGFRLEHARGLDLTGWTD
ncbi:MULTISPECIES: DUF4139 domain-containing protein [unclassified Pseudofrankia]|uniref:DUF4139 domain-containing protein n=1 Tax=unclassified Pseudofrankia TaxID=2994372 RepID=UPI0008DB186D|nr:MULTISPECIES: DUF4139 domain-containing protein [unclassified Pseudofrankia]MDT3442366.1 DUF4139 domain-containing protein [Pseudofrankia sp. BMG5.37]OHV47896.1 mucoidy inhibitor A [Pseudofrankia sp. BMG5.36]